MRVRTTVTILAIAAIFLAAMAMATPVAVCAIGIALLAPVIVRPAARVVVHCEDQPVSLFALVSFRAPPCAACA